MFPYPFLEAAYMAKMSGGGKVKPITITEIPSRLDVANDNRIVRQKTILPDFGSESSY